MNKAKELAQKKIGPLPVWTIAAVIGGAVLFKLMRGGASRVSSKTALADVGQPGGGFPNGIGETPASSSPIETPNDSGSPGPAPSAPVLTPAIVTRPTSSVAAPITEAAPFLSGPIFVKQQTKDSGNIPAGAVVATGGLPDQAHPISLSPWYQQQLGLTRVGSTLQTTKPGVKIVE